ncbi:MAG: GGDEF domain-containing protein [Polyangiaceae bacterium]
MTPHNRTLDAALDELRRQIEALVREEQLRDQLTGLGNAQALSETLKTALESDVSFWLAFLDVDYFKRINDKYGYQLADGLL